MTGRGALIALGQTALCDKAHDAIGVAAQNRNALAMHRIHDRIQGRFIDVLDGLSAIKAIGEAIQRHLLVGASRDNRLSALARCDVAGDFRGADDSATFVAHRGNGERYVDQTAVLAAPNGLVVLNALAAPDTLQDLRFFAFEMMRDDRGDRFTDHFFRGISEQMLGARIPADDGALEILADDRIVGRFDDAGELSACFLAAALIGYVEERGDPAFDISCSVKLGPVSDGELALAAMRKFQFAFEVYRLAF